MQALGNLDAEGLHLLGVRNPGSTDPERLEAANHQPGDHQQHERQRISATTSTFRARLRVRPSLADRPPP